MKRYSLLCALILFSILAAACNPFPAPTPTLVIPTFAPPTAVAPPSPVPPTATLAPTATVAPTVAPTATRVPATATRRPTFAAPTSAPVGMPRRIHFAPGATSSVVQGSLPVNGMDMYILRALAGQTMNVRVVANPAIMLLQISGADGQVFKSAGAGAPEWSGQLPSTQDYYLGLFTANGAPAAYTLEVIIPPLPTPISQQPRRISFQPGSTSAAVQGTLGQNGIDVYVLRVLAGQRMTVMTASPQGNLLLSVSGADGQVLKSSGAGTANYSGIMPSTQDYYLTVTTATGTPANYSLQVIIPPPGG